MLCSSHPLFDVESPHATVVNCTHDPTFTNRAVTTGTTSAHLIQLNKRCTGAPWQYLFLAKANAALFSPFDPVMVNSYLAFQ
jgi:hypothetical protein